MPGVRASQGEGWGRSSQVLPDCPVAQHPAEGLNSVALESAAAVLSGSGVPAGSGACSVGGRELSTTWPAGGSREGRWARNTCRSAMEVFNLCSLAQAAELALMPCSCSRMAGRRAPALSRSSRSRTTQWSHTAGRGEQTRRIRLSQGLEDQPKNGLAPWSQYERPPPGLWVMG